MSSQKQDEIYQNLFRAWNFEYTTETIKIIPNKDNFLQDIRNLINDLQAQYKTEKSKIGQSIISKTINNIQFMLNDILEIRTIKLLEAAKNLVKIDENLLFDMEINYYRSLFSAFKGYSKTKNLLVEGKEVNVNSPKDTIENIPPLKNQNVIESSPLKSKPEQTPSLGPQVTPSQNERINDGHFESIRKSGPPSEALAPVKGDNPKKIEKKFDGNFLLIRILKTTPSLVGEDFEIYGPFKEEDISYLPKKNAEILIEEQMAVKVGTPK